jgi:filamin
MNHRLAVRNWTPIARMEPALEDGITLAALLEVLSRQQVAPPGGLKKDPTLRIQKLNNLDYSFRFMKKESMYLAGQLLAYAAVDIRLENIGSEDLADQNRKIDLGLIWTLILHYQISIYQQSGIRYLKARCSFLVTS